MREIEFRAKRTDNDEWVYGYYFQELDFENKPITSSIVRNIITKNPIYKTTEQGVYEIDIDTLGQYTGLKDKNGKKIFEGDIIRINMNRNRVVRYDDIKASFVTHDASQWLGYLGDYESWNLLVVGNIWDNPELLKGEE